MYASAFMVSSHSWQRGSRDGKIVENFGLQHREYLFWDDHCGDVRVNRMNVQRRKYPGTDCGSHECIRVVSKAVKRLFGIRSCPPRRRCEILPFDAASSPGEPSRPLNIREF